MVIKDLSQPRSGGPNPNSPADGALRHRFREVCHALEIERRNANFEKLVGIGPRFPFGANYVK